MRRRVRDQCSSILERLRETRFRGCLSGLDGPMRSRVSRLMDFETVHSNLLAGEYASAEEFADDVTLTLDRAARYARISKRPSYIHRMVGVFRDVFASEWSRRFQRANGNCTTGGVPEPVEKAPVETTVDSDITMPKDHSSCQFQQTTGAEPVSRLSGSTQPPEVYRSRSSESTLSSTSSTRARSCISDEERRSIICRGWRRLTTERHRQAARRDIESISCTAGFQDSLDSVREFENLLGIRSNWIAG